MAMSKVTDIHAREQMGWAFVLVGFAVFLAIAISVPVGVSAYLQNTKQPLTTTVQANQGTVRIDDQSGLMRATLEGEPAEAIEAGSGILTDATATALVFVASPDDGQVLSRMQVYGNTNVHFETIDAPRFGVSSDDRRLHFSLLSGRLRLAVPDLNDRGLSIRLAAPRGEVTIDKAGQYSFEVTNAAAQIAVLEGQAEVNVGDDMLSLTSDQRAVIPNQGAMVGPVDTERNLIRNGSFNQFLDDWTLFTWRLELADQPKGSTDVRSTGGEPALHIVRNGEGHADVKLSQSIDQDVTDYASLRLLLTFRISAQSLAVCGSLGSECPLFLSLDYVDDNGIGHTWQHGFYGVGQVLGGSAPEACVSCDVVQSSHQFVQLGRVYFYESDLRADLARQGFLPPRVIESVTLVASGHSFEVDVVDIALMAKE